MVKKCCAFLSALMIVLFSTFSHYAAIPAYAAMDPRYYVAAGPLIASMFTAYGYKRSGTNAALANLVAEAVVDAADAGYTTVRNGVESIAIGIQNGKSYVSNAFNEWLYNWCNHKKMSENINQSGVINYPSVSQNGNMVFTPYNGTWDSFVSSASGGFDVVAQISRYCNDHDIDLSQYNYFSFDHVIGGSYDTFHFGYRNLTSSSYNVIFAYYNNSYPDRGGYYILQSSAYISGISISYKRKDGSFDSISSSNCPSYVGSGTYNRTDNLWPCYYYSTYSANYTVGNAGYTVSADAPAANKTFTEYMSNPASWSGLSWGGQVANVPIDNVDTQAVPITIPIDIIINGQQIGAAVADIISGAQATIDAALAMTQEVAREGAITQAAQGELEEANTAVDNTIEVADAQTIVSDIVGWGVDYVKPHLSNVFRKFPFSIPYDFYLLLKSMYGNGGNTRKLRSVKISNASEDIFNLDPSSIPVVVDFDYVLPDQIGESDPAAPKFIYDLTINAFGKPYHAEGTLDLAPFGGYFKLLKMGLAIIWIMDLLLFTQQQISNMKGGQ